MQRPASYSQPSEKCVHVYVSVDHDCDNSSNDDQIM